MMIDENRGSASKANKVPARLFAILAREAPKAVILRRGPSKWVELILWHTNTDTFERGQWFKGRIYERACDLSPNGYRFLYFATKYHLEKWARAKAANDPERIYEWTAISKPPYFTALALWSQSDPTAIFGGVFLDNHEGVLWGDPNRLKLTKGRVPENFKITVGSDKRNNIWRERVKLDGWSVLQEYEWQYSPGKVAKLEVHRKLGPEGDKAVLLKTDFRSYHYSLVDAIDNKPMDMAFVTWIDWDQQGRLVFTREGKLYAGPADVAGPQVIADFNADAPTDVIAPEWARKW